MESDVTYLRSTGTEEGRIDPLSPLPQVGSSGLSHCAKSACPRYYGLVQGPWQWCHLHAYVNMLFPDLNLYRDAHNRCEFSSPLRKPSQAAAECEMTIFLNLAFSFWVRDARRVNEDKGQVETFSLLSMSPCFWAFVYSIYLRGRSTEEGEQIWWNLDLNKKHSRIKFLKERIEHLHELEVGKDF